MGRLTEALAYVLIGLGFNLLERARPDIYRAKRAVYRTHSSIHQVPGNSDRDIVNTLVAEVEVNHPRRDW